MSELLPVGWAEAKLHKCVDVLDSRRIPVNSEERAKRQGNIPYYGATGQVGWIDDSIFDEELVLIGEDGAPFFDKAKPIAYIIQGKSWVNNHVHVLRAITSITNNQYLKHYFDWFDFHDYVNGTTRLKLTQGSMNEIPVRLAPIKEQLRIVTKLEKLLEKVESSQTRLEKIPATLKRFRQSVLAAACSGRLTADWRGKHKDQESVINFLKKMKISEDSYQLSDDLPNTWASTSLSVFVESMMNGIYKPEAYYNNDGVACLRMYNIQEGKIIWVNLKRMDLTKAEIDKYELVDGDILVNRVNSRELVGKSGILKGMPERAVFESKNIRLRLRKKTILPEYVTYCFLTRIVRDAFEESAKQTVGMATVSQPQIASLRIPIPPLPEQQEIVTHVEELFTLADRIEVRCQKAKAQVDKITQSILAKAFRGELVLQDPNDEPASELFTRVKEERSKMERVGFTRGVQRKNNN